MRSAIENLEASKIREVANAGLGRSDVLAFWFGESDEVTPDFIRQAAIDSLRQGETFYAHNLGLPSLRDAIAQTMTRRHGPAVGGAEIGADRIAVTSGGVNALMLAVQALVDAGDEVVAVTPIWPNLTAQPLIMGACLKTVSLVPRAGAWTLDLEALLSQVTSRTRLLILNAPNNPTGWTLSAQEQGAILAHCRRNDLVKFYIRKGTIYIFIKEISEEEKQISKNSYKFIVGKQEFQFNSNIEMLRLIIENEACNEDYKRHFYFFFHFNILFNLKCLIYCSLQASKSLTNLIKSKFDLISI